MARWYPSLRWGTVTVVLLVLNKRTRSRCGPEPLIPTEATMNSDVYIKVFGEDVFPYVDKFNLAQYEWFHQDRAACHVLNTNFFFHLLQRTPIPCVAMSKGESRFNPDWELLGADQIRALKDGRKPQSAPRRRGRQALVRRYQNSVRS